MAYIKTVKDLRHALKGINGDKEISVRIPWGNKGFYNPNIQKLVWNDKFEMFQLLTNEVGG